MKITTERVTRVMIRRVMFRRVGRMTGQEGGEGGRPRIKDGARRKGNDDDKGDGDDEGDDWNR